MRTMIILCFVFVMAVAVGYTSGQTQHDDNKKGSMLELLGRRKDSSKKEPVRHDSQGVKGDADHKKKLHLNLRKGEYVCGEKMDRVCRLRPGQVPPGCNGICQYPIGP